MKAISLIRSTGLSTAQIADLVGCTPHAIRYYERGERFPSPQKFEAIVRAAEQRGLRLSATDFTRQEASNG